MGGRNIVYTESIESINEDIRLRKALYAIYVAQFNAIQQYPEHFNKNHATRMLTSLMGSRRWSWPVIGITPAALELFSKNNFGKVKTEIQRGHIHNRSETAHQLFYENKKVLTLKKFFEYFLSRDNTVLMLRSENPGRSNAKPPKFIRINTKLNLFQSASLVGWRHGQDEKNYLEKLYMRRKKLKVAKVNV